METKIHNIAAPTCANRALSAGAIVHGACVEERKLILFENEDTATMLDLHTSQVFYISASFLLSGIYKFVGRYPVTVTFNSDKENSNES